MILWAGPAHAGMVRKPRASGDDPLTAYQPVIGSG